MDGPKMRNPTGQGSGFNQSAGSGIDGKHHTAKRSKIKKFDREVFTLACHLKGDSETCQPTDFEDAISQWSKDRGYSFVSVIQAVTEAWANVKGDWTLESIMGGFQSDPVPDVGNPTYRSDSAYGDALKVLWRLQRHAGRDEPFYITTDKLGALVQVDKRTAARYLAAAHQDGVLVMAEEARPNRCRRWYFPQAMPSIEEEAKRLSGSVKRDDDNSLPF